MLTVALLALAAFAAGVTGAWSPCGFSMVETIAGAAGREGDAARRTIRTSCATFAAGALLGGVATFGLLGALGGLLGAGGGGALAVAAGLAVAAAVADALGLRVAPQIRRQVPEPWRRRMPLPLAVALYGVLLGLGFTTFVLAFAVWALAGIAVALGSAPAGAAIGVAFGLGRALPVVALAPRFEQRGADLAERMAGEPRLLRRLRAADAALLLASALALLLGGSVATAHGAEPGEARAATGTAGAARAARGGPGDARTTASRRPVVVAKGATDPSFSAPALAYVRTVGGTRLRLPDADVVLASRLAALGGPHLAQVAGGAIAVSDWTRHTTPVFSPAGDAVARVASGAAVTQLAVSSRWLVWLTRDADGGQTLLATPLPAAADYPSTALARSTGRLRIGRPALAGDRLAYALSSARGGSRIVLHDLAAGKVSVVRRSARTQLSQPALRHDRLLYVEARACDQRLLLTRLGRSTRTLLRIGSPGRRDAGHEHGHTTQGSEPTDCPRGTPRHDGRMLWTTALGAGSAYVTLLRPAASARRDRATLVRIPL